MKTLSRRTDLSGADYNVDWWCNSNIVPYRATAVRRVPCAVVALCLAAWMFSGCVAVQEGHDPVVVNAERATAIAFDIIDTFLRVEHEQRDWFRVHAPQVHVVAEDLRRHGPEAFATARAMTRSYKANRTLANKANLETALAVINRLGAEAAKWLALIQQTQAYGPSDNLLGDQRRQRAA